MLQIFVNFLIERKSFFIRHLYSVRIYRHTLASFLAASKANHNDSIDLIITFSIKHFRNIFCKFSFVFKANRNLIGHIYHVFVSLIFSLVLLTRNATSYSLWYLHIITYHLLVQYIVIIFVLF